MKKAQQLHTYLCTVEPTPGLYQAIVLRIAAAKKHAARVRTSLFGVLALVSGLALVPAVQYAGEQFYASGFYDYLTLIVSDRGFVIAYWQQFALSLVESLPSLSLLLLLPLVFALVYSLRRVVQTGRVAFA